MEKLISDWVFLNSEVDILTPNKIVPRLSIMALRAFAAPCFFDDSVGSTCAVRGMDWPDELG